jgi:hypothetical protein
MAGNVIRVGWLPEGYKFIEGISTLFVGSGIIGVGKFAAWRYFFGFRRLREGGFVVVVLGVVVVMGGSGVVVVFSVVFCMRITGVGHSAFMFLSFLDFLGGTWVLSGVVGLCGINAGPPAGRISKTLGVFCCFCCFFTFGAFGVGRLNGSRPSFDLSFAGRFLGG